MRLSLACIAAVALALAPTAGLAWQDNFDSYPVGPLVPQGGWTGWEGNPAATAYVVNQPFRSAPNSAEIRPTSDCVQQFSGVNSGQWIFTAWSYVPAGITGNQYFILLNTYGPPHNWSLQVHFNLANNVVIDDGNPNGPTIPIVRGQWVELQVFIDFAIDQQTVFYNGVLLNQMSWTAGLSGGGVLNLAALDLFSDATPSIYWDDLLLREEGGVPVAPTSWGQIKANFR